MRRVLACEQCPRLSGVSAHLRAGFSGTLKALEAPAVIRLLLAVAQRRPCCVLNCSKAALTPRSARSFLSLITSTHLKRHVSVDKVWNQRRRHSYMDPEDLCVEYPDHLPLKPELKRKNTHVTEFCLNHVCNSYLVFKKRALDMRSKPASLPARQVYEEPTSTASQGCTRISFFLHPARTQPRLNTRSSQLARGWSRMSATVSREHSTSYTAVHTKVCTWYSLAPSRRKSAIESRQNLKLENQLLALPSALCVR